MSARTTKPAYLWALGITTVLTVWALVAPTPAPAPAVAEMQREPGPSISRGAAKAEPSASAIRGDHAEISAAQFDIFADRRRPAAADTSAAPLAPPTASLELVGPPLPPPPPPLNIQFAGRFRAPDGKAMVYLRDGERFVVAKVGDVVSSGYQITALLGEGQRVLKPDDNAGRVVALRFLYAPLRHTEILMLPPEAVAP